MTIMSCFDASAIASIQFLQRQAASLLLYQSVLFGEVGGSFLDLLQTLRHRDRDGLSYLQAYGRWFKAAAAVRQSWQDYLIAQILLNDYPTSPANRFRKFTTRFSRRSAAGSASFAKSLRMQRDST